MRLGLKLWAFLIFLVFGAFFRSRSPVAERPGQSRFADQPLSIMAVEQSLSNLGYAYKLMPHYQSSAIGVSRRMGTKKSRFSGSLFEGARIDLPMAARIG